MTVLMNTSEDNDILGRSNMIEMASYFVLAILAFVFFAILSCAWEAYLLVKSGWRREDEPPWDDDLE